MNKIFKFLIIPIIFFILYEITSFDNKYINRSIINIDINNVRNPPLKKIVRKLDLYLGSLYFNLSKKNKPKDYKEQLLKIDQTIKQSKMYHNDYFLRHFFVKNEKIYLIDWNNFIDYVPKWAKDRNNINTIIDKLK